MSLMLPHLILSDLFDEDCVVGLLAHVRAHEAAFVPTSVAEGRGVDRALRVSAKLHDMGAFATTIRSRLLDLLPELTGKLGIRPVARPKVEIELVAHGDGAFFTRHIDTLTAPDSAADPSVRVLSGVYYFHAEPKAFTGGALRIHGVGAPGKDNFVDIEPVRNSLVVFPSWSPHEVRPVVCPSQRHADARFAVNCWIHERTGSPAT